MSRVGQQLGNYRLTHLVGAGGFAEVYVGEHIHLGTRAAIKVLHTQLGDVGAIEGFQKEARIIAQLVHPNIVRVLEFGVEQMVPFLVMDHAPHGSLSRLYARDMRVPLDTIVLHARQIASALQYAHDHKIVHRDIKPANMLVGAHNEILVSDFGIAVVSQSSHQQTEQDMAGTVAYMAPEQIQAHARPASDQYSLAIMVYEGLCGRRPFEGTFTEVAVKHITVQPPFLHTMISISPAVENVVFKALAKDASQRFSQVSEFAQALEQASRQVHQVSYATTAAMSTDANTVPAYLNRPTPPLIGPTQRAFLPSTQLVQGQMPLTPTPYPETPRASLDALTPLTAPFSRKSGHDAHMSTGYTGLFIPRFLLIGLYVFLMISSLLPLFSNDTFDAMQTFMHSPLTTSAPFSYMMWINLILPIECLLAGPVLGGRSGFLAVALSLTFYGGLEMLFFHSWFNLLLLPAFLLTPLFVGWLYGSRRSDGFLKVGARFFLGATLMVALYRLAHHLLYVHSPASPLAIFIAIILYGFDVVILVFSATLLERLIRFFIEILIKSQIRKG